MGNSSGSSREMRTLHYYDQLPKSAREALANANFNWATGRMLKSFETNRMRAKELVKYIKKIDDELAAKERKKVWGPDYPVIKGPI